MDEATRTDSPQVDETRSHESSAETRSPEEIRSDIEQTREELGDTVAGLAEKADVKAQAKSKVDEVKQRAAGKKDEFVGRARDATPESAGELGGQAAGTARENPIPVAAVGAFVAGLLIGRLTKRR